MRVEDFATIFRDGGVRVLLDWERLGSPEFGVTRAYSRSPRLLGGMFTVWYEGAAGRDADFRAAAARPLRVADAGRTERSWPAERTRRVADFETAFRRSREPVRLVLPAYALGGGGGLLLLDGTHRAVAAHRARVPVRLLVYALRGPVCEDVLPDLRHHATAPSPSGRGTGDG